MKTLILTQDNGNKQEFQYETIVQAVNLILENGSDWGVYLPHADEEESREICAQVCAYLE